MDQEFALELQKALGEAGGVAWCELYGQKEVDGILYTVKINVTARELNSTLALESLINTIKEAGEKYKMYPYNKMVAPKKVVQEDPFPIVQNSIEPVYEPVDGVQFMTITKIKIMPGTDGKTSVDMFMDGHQYADLKVKLTPVQLVGMFKQTGDWKTEHFERVGEVAVNWSVGWKNSSNLNKNGKPYKNVASVELA